MLDTGQDRRRIREAFPLITGHHALGHAAPEVRILPGTFRHPSPAGIRRHITHRRECPRIAIGGSLRGGHTGIIAYRIHIPGRGHAYVLRENDPAPVYDIVAEKNRYPEPAAVHSQPLEPHDFFRIPDTQYGSHASLFYQIIYVRCLSPGTCHHPAMDCHLTHLANLLLKSHPGHQPVHKNLLFAASAARCHGKQHQRNGQNLLFHRYVVFCHKIRKKMDIGMSEKSAVSDGSRATNAGDKRIFSK